MTETKSSVPFGMFPESFRAGLQMIIDARLYELNENPDCPMALDNYSNILQRITDELHAGNLESAKEALEFGVQMANDTLHPKPNPLVRLLSRIRK